MGLRLDSTDPIEKTLGRAELLLDLVSREYKEKCEERIKGICDNLESKIELQTVTKLYISYLVNCGFSKSHILSSATEIFLSNDIGRCTPHLLDRFFKCFEFGNKRKYSLLISGRESYIKFMAELFGMEIYSNQGQLPNYPITNLPAKFGDGAKKAITIFNDIPASDPFSAAKMGETLLGLTKSFHYLHPGKVSGKVDREIYSVEVKQNIATGVNIGSLFQPHQYLRSRSTRTEPIEGLANYVLTGNRQRTDRIMRSLNSVAMASNTPDLESRLVTIWSAFEALLPEPSKEEGKRVRISHFVPLIVPCTCYDYVWENFNECYENCSKEFGDSFKSAVKDLSGLDGAKGLATIMIGDAAKKKAILKEVDESPLMLNRFSKLHDLIEDPSKLIKYWHLHEHRVGWQIHRIYRERNDIVHKGAKSDFLEGLVENSYGYYRSVFVTLESVYKKYSVGDPTRALELVAELYLNKRTRVEEINKDSLLSKSEKSTKILDIIFDDRLC